MNKQILKQFGKKVREQREKLGFSQEKLGELAKVHDCSRAAEKYLQVNDIEKRKMLEKLLSNASIKNKNVAQYQFKSPYSVLAKVPKNTQLDGMLPVRDSNPN